MEAFAYLIALFYFAGFLGLAFIVHLVRNY
jgi:hypothetical protein